MWRRAIAPIAEWTAREFWRPSKRDTSSSLPTRLTQRHKREAKGGEPLPEAVTITAMVNVCRGCGKTIADQSRHCKNCAKDEWTKQMLEISQIGRRAAKSPQARLKRRGTQRRHHAARRSWNASSQPAWLTEQFYSEKIEPLLAQTSRTDIERTLGVSPAYAARIRRGERPHPRHWQALATLVAISGHP
jgi:hypothetical protein